MAYITNQSFFVSDIYIPNLHNAADLARINSFIAKYEPECLIQILGYPLYRLFTTENSQRMTDLLDGTTFLDGEGNVRDWLGLKHDTTVSLIANYIYFYYMKWHATQTIHKGTAVKIPEAGIAVSPAEKMTNAWNFFSGEVYNMTYFLWMKKDLNGVRIYPEFTYHQFLETRRITRKIDSVFSL
jgi:hypothetical protein